MLRIILAILLFVPFSPLATRAQGQPVFRPSAGIAQLVEKRGGRMSCWGVIIRLDRGRFWRTIRTPQIFIREAKHSHELKEIMTWRVVGRGKRLVIKFRPKMGDFGSGNRVEVQVARSALVGQAKSATGWLSWVIATDFPANGKTSETPQATKRPSV